MEQILKEEKAVGNVLLIIGYVSAFLGGLIGLFIGLHIWKANVMVDGRKIYKFDEQSRFHGKVMVIFAAALMSVSLFLQIAFSGYGALV